MKNQVGAPSDERFLQSDDVKKMAQETVNNLVMEVTTDDGYEVREGDEVGLVRLFEAFLNQQQQSSASFTQQQWDSVFWNEDMARPDKVTNTMNEMFSKDIHDEKHLKVNEKFKKDAKSGGMSLKLGQLGIEGHYSQEKIDFSKATKEDLLSKFPKLFKTSITKKTLLFSRKKSSLDVLF